MSAYCHNRVYDCNDFYINRSACNNCKYWYENGEDKNTGRDFDDPLELRDAFRGWWIGK